MLGRLGIVAVAAVFAFAQPSMAASSSDLAATHEYLTTTYTTLRATIASTSVIGKSVDQLNERFKGECPLVGAGSPQSEEEQKLSYEVFGALLATDYHTDAKLVQRFARKVNGLRWSNGKVTRHARSYVRSLRELVALPVPDLCGDVRAWSAVGFAKVPGSTAQFDRHVESIEGNPIPGNLLSPYVAPADRALAARDARLYKRLESIESTSGQDWWDMTLDTLGLGQ